MSALPTGRPSFREGLFGPSLLALAVTLVTAATLFLSLLYYVDGRLVVRSTEYLAFGPHDDGLVATARFFELQELETEEPVVVFVGASSTRESLIPALELAEELRAWSNRAVEVFDMTIGGETSWEMAALGELLGDHDRGVLVLGVSPFLFLYDTDVLADLTANPRLGITSGVMDDEARSLGMAVPWRTGVYGMDNRRFLLSRLPFLRQNILDGPVRHERYRFDLEDAAGEEIWTPLSEGLDARMETVAANRDYHLGILGTLIARANRGGRNRVVILEPPINPRLVRLMGERYDQHQQAISEFAAAQGALYWRLNEAVGLGESDYYDYGHLGNSDARARYSEALVVMLSPLLEEL